VPIYLLGEELAFPPPSRGPRQGPIAVGGDLDPQRVLLAYSMGIFPWPHRGLPLLWFSPDPRMVLLPSEIHVSRSLAKVIRRGPFRVTLDAAFEDVMLGCAQVPRPDQDGTWITTDMIAAYVRLHELGYAHSIEAWRDDELVGGLYGVSLGSVFFGESMFARAADASKVAFVTLVRQLERWAFDMVDCQTYTDHLARFGAEPWPRRRFLERLAQALQSPTRKGPWVFDSSA
jgi:leucyl/phenylalanyl-tRNA--protein transferase